MTLLYFNRSVPSSFSPKPIMIELIYELNVNKNLQGMFIRESVCTLLSILYNIK